jgi:hypothetical protein
MRQNMVGTIASAAVAAAITAVPAMAANGLCIFHEGISEQYNCVQYYGDGCAWCTGTNPPGYFGTGCDFITVIEYPGTMCLPS